MVQPIIILAEPSRRWPAWGRRQSYVIPGEVSRSMPGSSSQRADCLSTLVLHDSPTTKEHDTTIFSDQLNNSNIGGNFGSGQLVNHISYADDMCLLSFSTAGMQKVLNICDQYSNDHDLIYNSKKTMCMCFTPKSCKSYECKLSLNQESLSYVREARYLVFFYTI